MTTLTQTLEKLVEAQNDMAVAESRYKDDHPMWNSIGGFASSSEIKAQENYDKARSRLEYLRNNTDFQSLLDEARRLEEENKGLSHKLFHCGTDNEIWQSKVEALEKQLADRDRLLDEATEQLEAAVCGGTINPKKVDKVMMRYEQIRNKEPSQ